MNKQMNMEQVAEILAKSGEKYAVVESDQPPQGALKTTVIRATEKACAVVVTRLGRRLSAAVRLPHRTTAENHSGWPFASCCPFATAKGLHVSIWLDAQDDEVVAVPGGAKNRWIVMTFGAMVKVLCASGLLVKIDRKSDFVN